MLIGFAAPLTRLMASGEREAEGGLGGETSEKD